MSRRFARFFGQNAVDQFADAYNPGGSSAGGWAGLLQGCNNDATDLSIAAATLGYDTKAFYSGWNVAGKTIPWVMSGQCTRAAWVKAHTDLQAIAQPGDRFIFGNSGHGGQYDTSSAFNGGQLLCFFDGLFYDYEQRELMKKWPAGTFVLYILDSCYSGGLDRSILRAPIRAAPLFIKPDGARDFALAGSSDISAAIVEFCACQDNETAEDGPQNGAFTGSSLAVWDQYRDITHPLTYQRWFDDTAALMAPNFRQHPVLNVLGSGEVMLAMAI